MVWRFAHECLKGLPTAIIGGAIAAAAAFAGFRDWAAKLVLAGVAAMDSPSVIAGVIAVVITYAVAIVSTGYLARREERARPALRGRVVATIYGGSYPDDPARFVMFANLEIVNRGDAPGAISPRAWSMRLRVGREISTIPIYRMEAPITLEGGGLSFNATPDDDLLRKAREPIQGGAILDGYLLGAATAEQLQAYKDGAKLIIAFEDTHGQVTKVVYKKLNAGNPFFTFGTLRQING